jgi:hypothetical protein
MSTIIFIYNARSGKLNSLLDAAHKLISPKTYPCKLCALTYDTFAENAMWKKFRQETSLALEFLHSDEFEARYKNIKTTYPAIFLKNNHKITEWISKSDIESLASTDALIQLIKLKEETMNFSNPD